MTNTDAYDSRLLLTAANTVRMLGSATATVLFLYIAGRIIYRLVFHPLARFPGPKLAAISSCYEAYYQLIKGQGGQYIFRVQDMHKEYGPIVRISPDELHINDPDFYNTIYSNGRHIDKPKYNETQFGAPGAMFAAVDAEVHRKRRGSLNPFFSRQKILEQEKTIHRQVIKMCKRIETEYEGNGNILRFDYMIASMSADIMCDYVFDRSYNFLDAPAFMSPFTVSLDSFKEGAHTAIFFPWLPGLMNSLPTSVVTSIMPQIIPAIELRKAMQSQIISMQSDAAAAKPRAQGTIVQHIITAELPESEMRLERLADEVGGLVAAALETTKKTLSVLFFYVLSNPTMLTKLRTEISATSWHNAELPSIIQAEKLPYLDALIKEALRLGYGVVARGPRIHRKSGMQYQNWHIPPGTAVSTSTYTMHHNENVFPSSETFNPDRWMGNPTGPDGKTPLTQYLTAFSRGTRMCIGWQLAYAIMQVATVALVTKFELELYETTERDIVCTCDQVAPGVAPGSLGIRMQVNSAR